MLRRSITIGLLLTLFLVSLGEMPELVARSTSSGALRLRPVPRFCSAGHASLTREQKSVRTATHAGTTPLWGFLFSNSRPILEWGDMADIPGAFQPPYGWGHKMLWYRQTISYASTNQSARLQA